MRIRRYTSVVAVVAVLAVGAVSAAFASGAESDPDGDPNVSITVSPSDNLVDGQAVSVTGTGFQTSTAGSLRVCNTAEARICSAALVAVTTSPTGNLGPINVNVPKSFTSGTDSVNC